MTHTAVALLLSSVAAVESALFLTVISASLFCSVRSAGGSGIGRSVSVPLTESADRLHCQQPATRCVLWCGRCQEEGALAGLSAGL